MIKDTRNNTISIIYMVLIAFLVFNGVTLIQAQNSSDLEFRMPRHVPTLDDDFIDNRVIVTLKQEYSDVIKAIDEDLYRNALSDRSMIKSIEDLTYITNPSIITDRASFVQILSIYLRDNSKENVLSVIYELEKLDSVLAAEPAYNYIAIDLWTPNDPMFNNQW